MAICVYSWNGATVGEGLNVALSEGSVDAQLFAPGLAPPLSGVVANLADAHVVCHVGVRGNVRAVGGGVIQPQRGGYQQENQELFHLDGIDELS